MTGPTNQQTNDGCVLAEPTAVTLISLQFCLDDVLIRESADVTCVSRSHED